MNDQFSREIAIKAACANCRHFKMTDGSPRGKCTVPTLDPAAFGRPRHWTDWCMSWAADEALTKMLEGCGCDGSH